MPSPNATPTPITPPRVPLIDARTGLIDRAWYLFFLSLNQIATNVVDDVVGPDAESLIASYDAALRSVNQELQTLPPAIDYTEDILKIRHEGNLQPSSEVGELQALINEVRQTLETLPKPELGSMAPLEQDNVPWLTFNTAPSPVPTAIGSMYWDGGTTMNLQATANVLIRIGEAEYIYVKASSAVTKGQLCYHTGSVGASGVITVAPTPLALADPNQIVGVAAETIALNGFGLILLSGDLRGFNTTGSSVGETWADGDPLYYNPAYVGSFTKVKPSAPNQKTYIGEVINAGAGSSGSINVRIIPGSTLGGTDGNVQFGTLANGDIIQYDSALQYWKNVPLSTAGIVTSVTGTSPVVSSGGTTPAISLATAYGDTKNPYAAKTANYVLAGPTTGAAAVPTFRALVAADIPALPYGTGTVTSVSVVSANGFAGTVATATTTPAITMSTSISGLLYGNGTALAATTVSAPLAYSAGTLSITQSGTASNGYLSSTDWNTFNNKGSGTVTSVAALTLGTTGTDLSSTVANGTTTPVITLNVPTASATNRGALSSTDWSTFNNKQSVSAPVTKTADFTVATTDLWLINNKSGSTCTVTLPAASSWTGRTLTFKNMQAQTLVSASSNVVPIDSTVAGTAILLAVVGNWATMVSDGTNWVIMQQAANNCLLLE